MALKKKRSTTLLPKRKARILGFKLQSLSSPDEFGALGSKKWRRKLLEHMEDPDVTATDIDRWLKNHEWILERMTPSPPQMEGQARREGSPLEARSLRCRSRSLTPWTRPTSPKHADSDFGDSTETKPVLANTDPPNRQPRIPRPKTESKGIVKSRPKRRAKVAHRSSKRPSAGKRKRRRSSSSDSVVLQRDLDNIREEFVEDSDVEEIFPNGGRRMGTSAFKVPGARRHSSSTVDADLGNSNQNRPLRPTPITPGLGTLTQARGGGAGFRAGSGDRSFPMNYYYDRGSRSGSRDLTEPADRPSKEAFLLQTICGHSYSIGCFLKELPDPADMTGPLDTFVQSVLLYYERKFR